MSPSERITHGRHCTCSACAQQDWAEPQLAPCGMHGSSCPPRYDPWGMAGNLRVCPGCGAVEPGHPADACPLTTRIDVFTALCDDDRCPWKFRGVTGPHTNQKGQEHVDETGHSVTIYFEHRWRLEPGR